MAIYATFEKLYYYKLWFQVHICEWMNLLQNEISLRLRKLRDDTHMTSMKTAKFLRHPTPSVHLCPKCFHTLDLGRPILNKPPTLSNKLWNNNRTVHVNERNQNNAKCHILIDHAFYCSIQATNKAMASLKGDFNVWHQW